MNQENRIDPRLSAMLEELKEVPPREARAAARGRARFMTEAIKLHAAVSGRSAWRLNRWKIQPRRFAMTTLITIATIVAMLFGGGAATVYAAQDDLPTAPLYGVKTFVEDARLWFNADPQTEIDMLLEFVQTRIEEMIQLTALGVTPPANVTERLQLHIDQALQVAAGMEDAAMQGALQQIHTNLQTQAQVMTILQTQSQGEATQILEQTRTMLETRVRMVDSGQADPQGFRNTIREEKQDEFPGTPGPGYGPGPSETPMPGGGGMGPGSNPSETPMPGGGGMGPGSNPSETPMPGGSGTGSGSGGTPGPGGNGGGNKP
ncbi:MAG: DUF5667 domain-containing protein [Anaerolineales bacterium]|nr:DUF5667 domain-containing protein [Anaerolineales bacterium]